MGLLPGAATASYQADPFVMDMWRNMRGASDLFIFNFRASWSITCDIKAEILDQIICDDASYETLRVVEVDWDTFGPSEMAKRLKIRRQSTLILLQGRRELARVENEPNERALRAFLDQAVAAR